MKLKRQNARLFLIIFMLIPAIGWSQNMITSSALTPAQLVNDVLLGGGITASNITYSGHNSSRGSFSAGASVSFLMDEGIILSSGFLSNIPGWNTSGMTSDAASSQADSDLDALVSGLGGSTTDKAVLEFDFVAVSDTLVFNYIFASEEYPEFNCSPFNDVFAFFLSGPNPAGGNYVKKNLAIIPSTTTYVGINTINSGIIGSLGDPANCTGVDPNWASYGVYYNDNPKNMNVIKIRPDGYTDVFTASASLTAGATYHIKLAIADVGSSPFSDNGWDSYVFIQKQSFSSPSMTVAAVANPAVICGAGAPVNIVTTVTNGTGDFDYVWSNGTNHMNSLSNKDSITVNPMVTTTYTVTVTSSTGVTATNSVTVTVNTPVTPDFAPIPAFCSGSVAPVLATTSPNGINGSWSPATISNTAGGSYTFTPTAGQCASTQTLNVTVTPQTTPDFAAIPAFCSGSVAPVLASTSPNGINGSWSPATISNTAGGSYTFTPAGGQCATTQTLNVTVTPLTTPDFAAIPAFCSGSVAPVLATTSPNGISGTWSPATISNTAGGSYTFTPAGGQCASTQTLNVTVTSQTAPDFAAIPAFCSGSVAPVLASTSPNGISGSWSPATISNTTGGSYTFTPAGGQCATTQTLNVTVTPLTTPDFAPIPTFCYGSVAPVLGTTSPNGISGSWSPATISNTTGGSYTFTPAGGQCAATQTLNVTITSQITAVLSGGTSPICDKTNPGTFTVTASGGSGSYTYQWYNAQGAISGATNSTYNPGIMTNSNGFYCSVTSSPCGWIYSDTTIVMVMPQVGNATPITISSGTDPVCQLTNGTTTTTYATTASNNLGFTWSLSNPLAGTIDPATGVMTWADGFYGTVDIQVIALGCAASSPMIVHAVNVSQPPTAEAGTHGTYAGIPVALGNASSGPGTYSWSPATGLSDPAISQPLASPPATITYTLTVNNNGCIATDTVTVIFGGVGHTISGKTLYAGKANAGNPVPNTPTYNPVIYSLNKVIVILKTSPANDEVARDTSDANGVYQFTNIMDGNYTLYYDKLTADTMMWGNDVNAIDVALMKYLIGSDTLQDPTRCFTSKYKKAANVDNNASINAVDVARIKAKIGAPYDAFRNFPRGNWVAMDKSLTVAGADVNMNLETICYGDYNASSSKYRDSTNLWSGAKSLPADIIVGSQEVITTNDPTYFEIPLRISSKVNEFSALGLELNYQNSEYKLVSAFMPGTKTKGAVKINPSLEEIIVQDNDLLVTDDHGTIRVVYATTNHFDVAPNDKMIVLGFRPLKNPGPGEIEFSLSGTGVIGNQFGEENEETYLLMPKIFVQGNTDAGFEFSGYPNPFNGEASINYYLPENGMVRLSVYNAIGELVVTLVNENQESGKHSVLFSQHNLASGMYTFKLDYSNSDKSESLILKLIH